MTDLPQHPELQVPGLFDDSAVVVAHELMALEDMVRIVKTHPTLLPQGVLRVGRAFEIAKQKQSRAMELAAWNLGFFVADEMQVAAACLDIPSTTLLEGAFHRCASHGHLPKELCNLFSIRTLSLRYKLIADNTREQVMATFAQRAP